MTKDEHDRLVDLTNLQNRIKELEEINKEEQKINGNLQVELTKEKEKNKKLQEELTGKAIHEMGTSNLYKED